MVSGPIVLTVETRERLAREHMEKARTLKTDTQEQIEEVIKHLTHVIEVKPFFIAALMQRAHLAARIGKYQLALADLTIIIQLEEYGIDRRRLAAAYGSRAAVYRKLNKNGEGIIDFSRAADVEPDNGTWLYELGLLYSVQGLKHLARQFIAASLSEKVTGRMTEGTRFRALTSLGACKLDGGDTAGAIAVLSRGFEIQETPALHNLLGIAHFLRGEYEAARLNFDRAIELDVAVGEYHTNAALCCFQLGLYSEAFKLMEYAVRKDGQNARCYFFRANIGFMLGLYSPAMTDIVRAVELDPSYAPLYYSKALVHVASEEYEGAKEALILAIQLNPKLRTALMHLGLLHYLQANYFDALECFFRALELEEEDATVHEWIGLVYCEIKYYDLAATSFTRCIDLSAENPLLYFRRGTALFLCGDVQGAYEDLQICIFEHKTRRPEALNNLSAVLRKLGKDKEALEYANEAVALNDKNHCYLLQRAECFFSLGDYSAVLEDLASITELGHESAELYYLQGRSKYALRDFHGAAEALIKASALQPGLSDCPDYCYALGVAYLCSGTKVDEAEKFLTKAITSHDNPPPLYYDERARARQRLKDTRGMLEDLNFVLQNNQNDPTIFLRRSLGYKAVGLYDEAARDFEKAKTINGAREVLENVPYEKFFDIEQVWWSNGSE
uniref:Uncharacterized protein n=1 Tax=Trypanosoma congolense (strain IL3000) TaxID=1068625 RepID=G0UPJ4_TRYCI|nr:conserved hypothetical protein [Trypanosoma congolense IL3000]